MTMHQGGRKGWNVAVMPSVLYVSAIGAEGFSRMLQSLLEAGFILQDQSGRKGVHEGVRPLPRRSPEEAQMLEW
jgi:hypothetical protein